MSNVEFTSEVVRGAKFREKLKGYHPEEVDAFMERTAVAIDQLTGRLAEATARALKAEAALAGNSEADESVRRTLVLAQRTAEMAVREANEEAQRLRVDARAESERLTADASGRLERAQEEAARVEALANDHATETVDQADARAQELLRDAAEKIEAMEAEAAARISTDRIAEEADRHARERAATQQIEARTAALKGQYDRMWKDVEALSAYLADERARVLDALQGATTRFGETMELAPAPEPSSDMDAVGWAHEVTEDGDVPDGEVEEPPVTDDGAQEWLAEEWPAGSDVEEPGDPGVEAPAAAASEEMADPALDGASAVGLLPDRSDPEWTPEAWATTPPAPIDEEPPARLLFTLDDERRRAEAEVDEGAVETKPKKTLLGRRRG